MVGTSSMRIVNNLSLGVNRWLISLKLFFAKVIINRHSVVVLALIFIIEKVFVLFLVNLARIKRNVSGGALLRELRWRFNKFRKPRLIGLLIQSRLIETFLMVKGSIEGVFLEFLARTLAPECFLQERRGRVKSTLALELQAPIHPYLVLHLPRLVTLLLPVTVY